MANLLRRCADERRVQLGACRQTACADFLIGKRLKERRRAQKNCAAVNGC
ncbi:hypothetical protein [Sutterella wadsworthensis]